jgi:glutaredoxin
MKPENQPKSVARQQAEMKTTKEVPAIVWVAMPVLIAGVIFSYFLFLSPSNLAAFAQCLTEKKAVFYGSNTCPHCAAQKRDFGRSFQYINYVECNNNGALAEACRLADVKAFPTWKFDGKDPTTGRQDLRNLAAKNSCTLPENVVQTGTDIVRPDDTTAPEVTPIVPTDIPAQTPVPTATPAK